MAISSYKPENNYTAASSPDPTEVILALLVEYSAKLTDKTGQMAQVKYRIYLWGCLFLSITLSAVLVDYFVVYIPSDVRAYSVGIVLAISLVLLFLLILDGYRWIILKRDVKILADQLKRLLGRASSIEDHGLLNFGQRFALDFRMEDAEMALHRTKQSPL